MPHSHIRWIKIAVIVSLLAYFIIWGGFSRPYGPLRFLPGISTSHFDDNKVALIHEVMQKADQAYVRELTPEDRNRFIEDSIAGGLSSLDQHSHYVPPSEQAQFRKQNQGAFAGIGVNVVVDRNTKKVTVISPMPNSPALKAGIRPGDEIEKIDGSPAIGLENDEVTERIGGPVGSTVRLVIRRRGTPRLLELEITREEIKLENVQADHRLPDQSWDYLHDKAYGIGYLRINHFTPGLVKDVEAILARLTEELHGCVIDLRDNPGGDLRAAIGLADLFLTEGEIVRVERRRDPPEILKATLEGTMLVPAEKYPLAILVNGQSASASEIFAAALQDHHRAIIVGQRTFGKGSVQGVYTLSDRKSGLRLTIGKYIRPSGKNIHRFPESKFSDDWGVRPDVEVQLFPQEEIERVRNRLYRDIIRDPLAIESENQERIAGWVGITGSSFTSIVPGASLSLLAECETGLFLLPRRPKAVPDRVLEKALEILRAKTG